MAAPPNTLPVRCFEDAGVVHNAVDQTSGVTEVYTTFISPTGTQPVIPVPDP